MLYTIRINGPKSGKGRKIAKLRGTASDRSGLPECDLHGLSHYEAMKKLLKFINDIIDNPDLDHMVPFQVNHGNSKYMRDYSHDLIRSKRFLVWNDYQIAKGNNGMTIVKNTDWDYRLPPRTPDEKREQEIEDEERLKKLLLPVDGGKDFSPIMRLEGYDDNQKDNKEEPIDFWDPDSYGPLAARHIMRVIHEEWEPDVDCEGEKLRIGDLVFVHPRLWQYEGTDQSTGKPRYTLDLTARELNDKGEWSYRSGEVIMEAEKDRILMVVADLKIDVPVDDLDEPTSFVLLMPTLNPHMRGWFQFHQVKVVSKV